MPPFTQKMLRSQSAPEWSGSVVRVSPTAPRSAAACLLDALNDRLAHAIANNAPLTIRSAKISLQELAKLETERDTARIKDSIEQCYQSSDFEEGVRAFMEKRKPLFKGE